jgi:SSS family solute:Na+ symporter
MASAADNPMGVEWMGMVLGLGFVLSFGYWCTDFLVVQRAMAANSMSAARRTPLIAAFPKMLFPFLVILPGMIAIARHFTDSPGLLPLADANDPSKGLDYNMTMPVMLGKFFPPGVLGLGLTALMASFMSGMAGNVTAFNTVWTYDIYQSYIRPGKSDRHYLWMGRLTTVWGILLSVAAAYVAAQYNSIMDVLQLVFSYVNAPLFGTFLLGMFWKRATGHGAFFGLLSGTLACALHHGLTLPRGADPGTIKGAWLGLNLHTYYSEMALNFYGAIWAFTACFVVTVVVSLATSRTKTDEQLKGLVYSLTPKVREHGVPWYRQPATLAVVVLVATILLNFLFW